MKNYGEFVTDILKTITLIFMIIVAGATTVAVATRIYNFIINM